MKNATVFFPGAGSFGGEFRGLVNACGPAAFVVRYPGRFGRDFGAAAESFDAVVDACVAQIVRRASVGTVLFGHSYGAYVAFATAVRLQETGNIAGLVAVGANAPSHLAVPCAALADAAGYLDRVDPQALEGAPSDEWRAIVVDTTAADLRLLIQFDTATSARLRCPILAVRGRSDPLTSDDGIGEWKHYTDGGFSSRILPGGHSAVLHDAAVLVGCRL